MLAALPQPLEVKEISDGTASLLGPMLIGITALLGVVLTVYTANRRHKRQLEHDSRRQKDQLEHDSRRQKDQLEHDSRRHEERLAHDLHLRRRDHIYDTLDAAVDRANKAIRANIAFASSVSARESNRNRHQKTLGSDGAPDSDKAYATRQIEYINNIFQESNENSHESLMEMRLDNWRLRVRFGIKDPIPIRHTELTNALWEVHGSLVPALNGPRSTAEEETTELTIAEKNTAINNFFDACQDWFHENS